jgi:hypothetical protein
LAAEERQYHVEWRYYADVALAYCGLLLDRRGRTRGIVDPRNGRKQDITEFCSKDLPDGEKAAEMSGGPPGCIEAGEQ